MIKRSNITWTDYSGGDANFVIRGRTAGDTVSGRGWLSDTGCAEYLAVV